MLEDDDDQEELEVDATEAMGWLAVLTAVVQLAEFVFGAVTRARQAWRQSRIPGPPAPPLVDPRMNGERRRNPRPGTSDDRRMDVEG